VDYQWGRHDHVVVMFFARCGSQVKAILTIDRCERKLFKKVGTMLVLETVPDVKPTGPKPMVPSEPRSPEVSEAAPKDCFNTVRPPHETGPIFSVPAAVPNPYLMEKLLPVLVPQDDETGVPAPAYAGKDVYQ
jgi:hypothetical protein